MDEQETTNMKSLKTHEEELSFQGFKRSFPRVLEPQRDTV